MAAPPRPRAVAVSYWCWLTACLVGTTTAAVTVLSFDQLQAGLLTMVEREFPNEATATRDEVATAALAILIGFGVTVVLAQMMVAILMHAGRRGARPALVLLAVIGGVYVVGVLGAVPLATKVGLLITAGLMAVAAILMFVPGVGRWFTGKHSNHYSLVDD